MMQEKLGNYEIINTIDIGSYGTAYEARDTELKRKVYLKIFPQEYSVHTKNLENLEREVRLASALDHPNICTIYDLNEVAGVHFVAMQYNEGRVVGELLRSGPLKLRNTLAIAIQVADALANAHSLGIVHGDIRPDNILITKDGRVKIVDFGFAKILAQKEMFTFSTTGRGIHIETCSFTPPEMVLGNNFDSRADIFQAGVLLFEMLTGTLPFQSEPSLDARHPLIFEEPMSLVKARATETPPFLQQILNHALAKKPSERYQRIAHFRDDLSSVLDDLENSLARRGPTTEHVLHANLWVEDENQQPLASPPKLTPEIPYFLLFAIEPKSREMVSSSQVFSEPSQLQKDSPVEVELVVTGDLLKHVSRRENRALKYYPGNGFPPESFALAPYDAGQHFVTVRLFYQFTILYRERIRIDVDGGNSQQPNYASSHQHHKERPSNVQF